MLVLYLGEYNNNYYTLHVWWPELPYLVHESTSVSVMLYFLEAAGDLGFITVILSLI